MRILMPLGLLMVVLSLTISQPALATDYGICEGDNVEENLYVLSFEKDKPCWTKASKKIDYSELKLRTKYLKFAYLFETAKPKRDYDRILSVQVKEPRKEEIDNDDFFFSVFREKMYTLCKDEPYPPFDTELQATQVTLDLFNRYHNGDTSEAGIFRRFHIEFKNRLQNCIQSNDKSSGRRKSFLVKGGPAPQTSGFIALVSNIFVTQANAITKRAQTKFRSVSVEILKGRFQGGLLQKSFKVLAQPDTEIVVRDLSKRLLSRAHGIKLIDSTSDK